MRQYTNGTSRLFVIITLISVKVVILLLSELYKSEITTIAIRFFRHYSCKIHIYFENCDWQNSTFGVQAVQAGAEPSSIEIVDIEDVPLAYLPGNATRVRVKAAGDLKYQSEVAIH